jgi:hypothetical protein
MSPFGLIGRRPSGAGYGHSMPVRPDVRASWPDLEKVHMARAFAGNAAGKRSIAAFCAMIARQQCGPRSRGKPVADNLIVIIIDYNGDQEMQLLLMDYIC